MANKIVSEVEKLLRRCNRTNKADLHSFFIEIDSGRAYVDVHYGIVWISLFFYDGSGNETRDHFRGDIAEATVYLEKLNARLDTVEM